MHDKYLWIANNIEKTILESRHLKVTLDVRYRLDYSAAMSTCVGAQIYFFERMIMMQHLMKRRNEDFKRIENEE